MAAETVRYGSCVGPVFAFVSLSAAQSRYAGTRDGMPGIRRKLPGRGWWDCDRKRGFGVGEKVPRSQESLLLTSRTKREMG